MKKRLRSPAILLTVFAMVLVVAGVAYAHWFSYTSIEGQINTGSIHMAWQNVGTDDDGWPDADYAGDNGGGTDFDFWQGDSSNDPSSPEPGVRETKDVGGCWAGEHEGGVIHWNIENGYPSYYCHLYADAVNHGSVPVKAAALNISAEKGFYTAHNPALGGDDLHQWWSGDESGEWLDFNFDGVRDAGEWAILHHDEFGSFVDLNDNGIFDDGELIHFEWHGFGMTLNPTGIEGEFLLNDELMFNITDGIYCGTQVDPGEEGTPVAGWIHVEQPAEQGATYRIWLEQEWVNWNEWEPGLCTFNGSPLS